ncbi:MAG: M56 family metallopeptidase [Nannocystales bacterium]
MNDWLLIDGRTLLDSALVAWHVRAAVGLLTVVLAGAALRSCHPRVRHRVLAWGMLAAVLLPTAAAFAPSTWGLPVGTRVQLAQTSPAITEATTLPTLVPVAQGLATVATAEAQAQAFDVGTGLSLLWAVGASVCLLGVGVSALGSMSLRSGSSRVPPAIEVLFGELQGQAGTAARLGITPRVVGPIVVGVLTPTVLLPIQATTWSDVRLRAVLAHELGHVAHGDHRWFPLAYVVRGLLWVNPLAWLVTRSFFRAAEFSADEAAVARGIKAPSYAAELLSLANSGVSTPAPMLAAAALGRPDVGTRIRRLLNTRPTVAQLRRVVPVTLGLLGAWTCIVLARPATVIPTDDTEQLASVPEARNLLPVPAGANRVSLRSGGLVVTAANGETWSHQPDAELQRHGHLLVDMHTLLDSSAGVPAPLVVDADRNVTFATLVDVLYTAGKAGVSNYYLQVPTPRGARVVSVSPPVFHATPPRLATTPDPRTQPALRVAVVVGEDALHVTTRPSRTVPPRYEDPQLSCQTTPKESGGPEQTARQLCAATDDAPIQMVYSGLQDTSYGALTDAIVRMVPPCGGTQIIEAGGHGTEPSGEPSCSETLHGLRVPRVR